MTSDKCSCGARDKAKCSKENGLGGGKMCLKEYELIPEELIERINIIRKRAKMNQTFEQRIQSIEDQLKEIRKELEESLAQYKQREYPFTITRWGNCLPKVTGTKSIYDKMFD